MKKSILLLCSLLLLLQATWAQITVVGSENFDGTSHTFSATTMNGATWTIDQTYYSNGTKSILGVVPFFAGDSIVLTSPVYDFTNYGWVQMSFAQICKVSALDECKVQYRLDAMGPMGAWKDVPASTYRGTARNYGAVGFNANSYAIWNGADSMALPVNSTWWQTEVFELNNEVSYDRAQFRFILKRNASAPTNVNYGWLIDAFKVEASTYEIKPPVVELINIYPSIVMTVGPYVVNAKVATRTAARIATPKMYWTAVLPNGLGTIRDSVDMTAYQGDSMWTASVPSYRYGTTIQYKIIGKDINGNTDSVASNPFTSQKSFTFYHYVGDTTIVTTKDEVPFTPYYEDSWSRTLYLASELTEGKITHIAWKSSSSDISVIDSVSIYFKLTQDTKVPINTAYNSAATSYIDPLADGATLVWYGTVTTEDDDWVDITLNTPFEIPAGYGLVVYVDDKAGYYEDPADWYAHPVSGDLRPIYEYDDDPLIYSPYEYNGRYSDRRPHTRFFYDNTADSTSGLLKSLTIADTIPVSLASPSQQFGVNMKNTGVYDLTSAVFGWSLNGVVQSNNVAWTGNITADMIVACNVGTYAPKFNGYDTLQVWINNLNGTALSMIKDTLTAIVYGTADIVIHWQKYLDDTVFTTGPFDVEVQAVSMTNHTISALDFIYWATKNGNTIKDTIPMTNNGNGIWSVVCPNISFGSDVIYGVETQDYIGNKVLVTKTSYVDPTRTRDYYYTGDTNTTRTGIAPADILYYYSWARMLYLPFEVENSTIFNIAFRTKNAIQNPYPDQKCYFKLVNMNTVDGMDGWDDKLYHNPIIDDTATLVWEGTLPPLQAGEWFDLELKQPFTVPAGYSLMVYYDHRNDAQLYYENASWLSTDVRYNGDEYYYLTTINSFDNIADSTKSGWDDEYRPIARFRMEKSVQWDTNSVALEKIITPANNQSIAAGNQPITVIVRNKGLNNMNCTIYYSINGAAPVSYNYNKGLGWGLIDTVNLGTFNAVVGDVYNITVWVANPNGQVDPDLSDDTLTTLAVACNGALSAGTYTIGASANADYATLDQFLRNLQFCGVNTHGTFKVEMESGTYNGANNISYVTEVLTSADTLIITSQAGNAGAVVFAHNGNVFELDSNFNVYITDVTINASAGTGAGVNFFRPCYNIEINGCVFNMHITNTSNTSSAIRFNGNDEKVRTGRTLAWGNLRILNNTMNYGYAGVYFYSPNSNAATLKANSGKFTIKNNKMNDFYAYGIYVTNYGKFDWVANNELTNRRASSQHGIYMNSYMKVDSGIVNNKIFFNHNSTVNSGLYLTYLNHPGNTGATTNALVANNEIIRLGNGTFTGIYISYNYADIVHNTVYRATGTGACKSLSIGNYNTSTGNTIIKNNIFHAGSTATVNNTNGNYAIYASNVNYVKSTYHVILDYNDYYSVGSYIGYVGNAKATLTDWRAVSLQDTNSISVRPILKDSSVNADINNYLDLMAPNCGVNEDINGTKRWDRTPMGAYTPLISTQGPDLSITEFVEPIGIISSSELCAPNYVAVKVAITNVGTSVIDFAQTPLKVTLQVSGADSAVIDTTISTGTFNPFNIDTVEITNALNVDLAGTLLLTASVTCSADTVYNDDTLAMTYGPTRWMLPLDEDFSNGFPESMHVRDNNTAATWAIMNDSNATGTVKPQFGKSMLAFDGGRGAESKLFTRQLNFTNTREPVLDFWYWHDTSANAGNDIVNVAYTVNGGVSYVALFNLQKNNGTDHGWKQYTAQLDSAIGATCVILIFDALRTTDPQQYDGEQYLDRIRIIAKQDVAVADILTSPVNVCNTTTDLSVVLENITSQTIDFSMYPTALQVDITGAMTQSFTYPLTSGTILALSKDTFDITTGLTLANGTYRIAAKLLTSIDGNAANDTLSKTITLNPSLNVVAQKVSSNNNCLISGTTINQVVDITNNGDMDMEDLILKLEVSNTSGSIVETLYDTISRTITVGLNVTHTFKYAYTVPNGEQYNVAVTVSPMCNAALTFNSVINECIDLNDLAVDGILVPANDGTCSKIGDRFSVKVKVSNHNPIDDAQNINLHAEILDNNNTQLASWTETISTINADDYAEVEFVPFTVPSVASFTVHAYLVGNSDVNPANDTAAPVTKCTDLGIADADVNGMSMSQNIPNPAKGKTSVTYIVPEDGKVMFNIMTVTGQILYIEEVSAMAGANRIEFNTESMASGIYFYSMTFNGQRIVKKMTIEK